MRVRSIPNESGASDIQFNKSRMNPINYSAYYTQMLFSQISEHLLTILENRCII